MCGGHVLWKTLSCTDLQETIVCRTFCAKDISVQAKLCGRHFCAGHFVWKTFLFRQNCVEDISVQAKLCGRQIERVCEVKILWKTFVYHDLSRARKEIYVEDKSNECVKVKIMWRHLCIMFCLVHVCVWEERNENKKEKIVVKNRCNFQNILKNLVQTHPESVEVLVFSVPTKDARFRFEKRKRNCYMAGS